MMQGGIDMVIHQEAIGDALEERPVSSCRHHWIIETANGPSSRGVCQNCQESKLFSNSIVEFERDVHNLQPAGRIDHSLKDTTTEQ
jgi:hypothetical protein